MENHKTIIALHGQFANGDMLRRDMGSPAWVDYYPDWHGLTHMMRMIATHAPVILVGYSLGGSRIATVMTTSVVSRIAGVVLYESPNLTDAIPEGKCPGLWIENRDGRGMCDGERRTNRYGREMEDTYRQWRTHHLMQTLLGEGRHMKRVWDYSGWWPRRRWAHGWDVKLNDRIYEVIKKW